MLWQFSLGGTGDQFWGYVCIKFTVRSWVILYTPLLGNDIIVINRYQSISNFTLRLMEDTGWYKVNYAVAGSLHYYEFLWGKGVLAYQISVLCVHIYCRTRLWFFHCWLWRLSILLCTSCHWRVYLWLSSFSMLYGAMCYKIVGCTELQAYCFNRTNYDDCFIFVPSSNGYCNSPGGRIVVNLLSRCFIWVNWCLVYTFWKSMEVDNRQGLWPFYRQSWQQSCLAFVRR